MTLPAEKASYTLDEYFALTEHEGEIRYEYHFGKIVAMAGGLLRHSYISGNAYAALHSQLKGKRCVPFNSGTRLQVATELWVYPDVMVSCHEEDLTARLYVKFPTLIIEVLSSSTRTIDYTLKNIIISKYLLYNITS